MVFITIEDGDHEIVDPRPIQGRGQAMECDVQSRVLAQMASSAQVPRSDVVSLQAASSQRCIGAVKDHARLP